MARAPSATAAVRIDAHEQGELPYWQISSASLELIPLISSDRTKQRASPLQNTPLALDLDLDLTRCYATVPADESALRGSIGVVSVR
jgi:hypothetical protein